MEWTTEAPTKVRGWFWAIVEGQPTTVRLVFVSQERGGHVKFADTGRITGTETFTHWQGPIPEPKPPA